MAKISTDYDIIGFYVVFMLLLNFFVLSFSGSIINGTDYLNAQTKDEISNDYGKALTWVLFANVPSISNAFWTTTAIRAIYLFIVFPYTIMFVWTIVKLLRGVM